MNIALIPLRKGSKGIPGKNKKRLLGRPLYTWALYEAAKSNLDEVYVFTDDDEIISFINEEYSWNNKINVIKRSIENATDISTTESAMVEFTEKLNIEFTTLTLIQATSPLLTSDDINLCLDSVIHDGFDSSLTVTPIRRFFWSATGLPLNYDYLRRPRRQDLKNDYVENGACYTVSKDQWYKNFNRLGGKINTIIMPEETYFEIDEKADFIIIEQLLKARLLKNKRKTFHPKLVALDVDGVFTNAKVEYGFNGEASKTFSMQDGMGIEILRKSGIIVVVITSENSEIVKSRMNKLQIPYLIMGVKDKYSRLDNLLNNLSISWDEIVYIGDDINDTTNIISSGFSMCPDNALGEIKQISDFVLNKSGGNGAVREAVEIVYKMLNRS